MKFELRFRLKSCRHPFGWHFGQFVWRRTSVKTCTRLSPRSFAGPGPASERHTSRRRTQAELRVRGLTKLPRRQRAVQAELGRDLLHGLGDGHGARHLACKRGDLVDNCLWKVHVDTKLVKRSQLPDTAAALRWLRCACPRITTAGVKFQRKTCPDSKVNIFLGNWYKTGPSQYPFTSYQYTR